MMTISMALQRVWDSKLPSGFKEGQTNCIVVIMASWGTAGKGRFNDLYVAVTFVYGGATLLFLACQNPFMF